MSNYAITLHWSPSDEAFIAEWIETARELGRTIPQPCDPKSCSFL